MKISTSERIYNRVLHEDARRSDNFFQSDIILKTYLDKYISHQGWKRMYDKWDQMGSAAAQQMNPLSLKADHHPPTLIKRNAWGHTINEIEFHPAYGEMMRLAVASDMLRIKWEPTLRKQFAGEQHSLGFASFFLFALSELGQHCPLCMTDGVALLLDRFAKADDLDQLLPHIYTEDPDDFWTGCMFLTEKSGGSDVGRNIVQAIHIEGDQYILKGEKWFCSNANGEIIFTLARTTDAPPGIRGISLFLVKKHLPNGSKNHIDIVRLKDKLGVRSMASAECIFEGAHATLIGEKNKGFKHMAEMVNLSRIHNALASVCAGRRALVEAYQFLSFRTTFGKVALEHVLVRAKLRELAALHTGQFYLLWRAVRAFDAAQQGNASEAELLRLLTPMLKKYTAETAVYMVRESMELMGGMGYIEDMVMPKIMRDVLVLPIWEGTSNIQVLDMLRASQKSTGLAQICELIRKQAQPELDHVLADLLEHQQKWARLSQDELALNGKYFFEKLTQLVQIAILIEEKDTENEAWIQPAIDFLGEKLTTHVAQNPISKEEVESMLAWSF